MPDYHERLLPTLWIYTVSLLLIPASILVLAPVSITAGVVTSVVLYSATVIALSLTAPVITVRGGQLRAGRATIDLELTGDAVAADARQARIERGTALDARAFLIIRGWVAPLVKVPIDDPADPTPYWLISTRRPTELAAAINRSPRPE